MLKIRRETFHCPECHSHFEMRVNNPHSATAMPCPECIRNEANAVLRQLGHDGYDEDELHAFLASIGYRKLPVEEVLH